MPTSLTVHELGERFRRRELTPSEATRAYLARIEALDPQVKAYLTVTSEQALRRAAEADARFAAGTPRGPLDGVPVAVKDVLCTRGIRTTCGSRILEGYVPPYDATAVARLLEAGAVLLGKLNMDEFAMGSSTENSAFFPTRNPWDLTRVPGGSSGGSAAAVAADLAAAALGTDTGGSIRQPAAFCGDVGLKPTYGRVSRYGLVAFASSLDQIGPLTKDVEDAALVLRAIAGHDPLDSTSVDVPVPDYRAELGRGVEGLRIGIPAEYFIEGLDPEVEAAVRAAIQVLEKLGARSQPVSLPHTQYGLAAYYLIAPAEASSNLARYDGVKYGLRTPRARDLIEMYSKTRAAGFGAEVKRRVMLGTYALSAGYYDAYYGKAQRVRTLVRRDFQEAFGRVDLIAAPTTPGVAFKFGGEPNTRTCPVCQGMPGTLPAINRRAVEFGIRTALALDCAVNALNRFARKHYYYPDMPKNYQISQYEEPLAEHGRLAIDVGGAARAVGVQRLHLEEDVGKLIHEGSLDTAPASHVDFNRAGVPLMEIVSRRDIRSSEGAAAYLRALRASLIYLGVCDRNMEEDSLRCDANISLRPKGSPELGTKVEIKNMNSFKNVQHALDYEIKRQARALESGERIVQETRLWDPDRGHTVSMRSKEYAHDYRYFPEPDLPPLQIEPRWVDEIRASLP